jgi:ABC-type branched-subunit amino acid transport system permease subunit
LALAGLGVVAVWWVANVASASDRGLVTNMAIFAMVALSLVVLSGWSGQVSLGQFAFEGRNWRLGCGISQ